MATTEISVNGVSSSKAAEIYRKDCGGIYYVCYHCGTYLDNITDTLTHIDIHFSSIIKIKNDVESIDIIDIKYEILDAVTDEVDSSQIEEIYIDCNDQFYEKELLRIDASNNQDTQMTPVTVRENFSDMDGNFVWKCLYCSNELKKYAKFQEHLATHALDPKGTTDKKIFISKLPYKLKCTLCPSEFMDANLSRQHLRDCHDQSIKCIFCSKIFVSTQLLNDHLTTNHGTNVSTAETVLSKTDQAEVSSNVFLAQHNTFLCILCDKTFTGTFNLMQHTFVHFNLKVFNCIKCPAKFQRKATAYEHMRKKHSLEGIIWDVQCKFCGDKMKNMFEFVTHSFTHHLDDGERNNSDLDSTFSYSCRFCTKNFAKWNHAREHLKIHSSDEFCRAYTMMNERCFSERAKSGMHRSEFLFNCSGCLRTLCGSFEARNHWLTEHRSLENNLSQTIPNANNNLGQQLPKKIFQKKILKCQECDGRFISEYSLMKHILVHFKVRPYSCTVCAKKFSVGKNVNKHMIKIHNLKPDDSHFQLDCNYCNAEFTEEFSLIAHMYSDHLYEHFNINDNLDGLCKYECQYCKEIVTERSQLDQHLNNHTGEALEPVQIMGSSINELRHKVEFMYCCLHCPKRFRLPHPAHEHVKYKHKTETTNRVKKNKKSITRDTHCELCNITFITWRSMLNHRAKRHPETHKKDRYKNRPIYYCSTCGKAYQDRGNLNQHEETHNRRTSYTCDICNNSYRTKNYIRTHMLSHTNEKNFICDQCGRSFYSVSKLNTHNQIHENLKLKCDQCEKVFFTRYNYSKHKKTHTDDNRKKCKLCDKYFKSSNSHRTHMLLHTGVKKYACRYCDMTFAQSSGRRGHEKLRHHVT